MATSTYEISLVVGGVEFTDDALDRIFKAFPDAVPARIADVVTITTPVAARSALDALSIAIRSIRETLPEATVQRVDQDLVAIPDIAERTDRSRESVRLLVDGQRGPGGFPAPVGTVGSGIRVWPWSTVVEWFSSSLGTDLGEHCIPPEVAAIIDAELAAARTTAA